MTIREMWLVRWTSDGAATRRQNGMVEAREEWRSTLENAGGTLVEFSLFSGYSEWDLMYIIDWQSNSDPVQFASGHLLARGNGLVEAAQVVQLVSPEDLDANVAAGQDSV